MRKEVWNKYTNEGGRGSENFLSPPARTILSTTALREDIISSGKPPIFSLVAKDRGTGGKKPFTEKLN